MDDETDDDLPRYDNVKIDDMEEIHSSIDTLKPVIPLQVVEEDEVSENAAPFPDYDYNNGHDDEPITPEALGTVLAKYRVEAEVSQSQRKTFEGNKAFFGRHVALSNTKRIDNLRHLDAQDLCNIYDRIPTMRHRSTQVRMRETSEFQMCRSNPEIGGFEAKIGVTNIRREDVDVHQSQELRNTSRPRKRGFFGLGKKKTGG